MAAVSVVALVFLSIILISNFKLRHDLGLTKHDLKQANETIQVDRDAIHDLEDRLEFLRLILVDQVANYRDSLTTARANTVKWKQQYAREKNYRVPANVSDAGLDSLISDLIRQRTND